VDVRSVRWDGNEEERAQNWNDLRHGFENDGIKITAAGKSGIFPGPLFLDFQSMSKSSVGFHGCLHIERNSGVAQQQDLLSLPFSSHGDNSLQIESRITSVPPHLLD